MLKPNTARRSLGLACSLAALLAAGCGGSSHSASERAQACSSAKQALRNYRAAALKVGETGVNARNKVNLEAASAAAGELRTQVLSLAKIQSGSKASQLNAFAGSLEQQQLVVAGIISGNVKAVEEHARGLNQGIAGGLLHLTTICLHP